MIGGVIVSHGLLAEELIRTAEMIVGRLPNITAVSIDVTTDVETSREQIRQAIELVNHGSGVIVFTDMFGGTPSNISLSFLKEADVEVINPPPCGHAPHLFQRRKHSTINSIEFPSF